VFKGPPSPSTACLESRKGDAGIDKEEKRPNAAILIAASLIAAVRLNREEIKSSPIVYSKIADSIRLAEMIQARLRGVRKDVPTGRGYFVSALRLEIIPRPTAGTPIVSVRRVCSLRFFRATEPDGSIDALLQSTRGAWTDAPGRRARIGNWMAVLPYSFLSIKPRNWVIWGGNG
jgi:hypothetical protein